MVYLKRNYSVPYTFEFGQIIRIQFTSSDRFKKTYQKFLLQNIPDSFVTDSKVMGKTILKNISDGFITDSKNVGKILLQNIPDRFKNFE